MSEKLSEYVIDIRKQDNLTYLDYWYINCITLKVYINYKRIKQ